MFKVFLTALVLMFSSSVYAADCPEGSKAKVDFLTEASERYDVYTLTPTARTKFIAYLTPIRAAQGTSLLPVDAEFYFALVEVNGSGVAWFYEGCSIPGSIALVPSNILAEALARAGITPDDMIEYKKGEDI